MKHTAKHCNLQTFVLVETSAASLPSTTKRCGVEEKGGHLRGQISNAQFGASVEIESVP